MDEEILKRLDEQDKKLDKIYISVEKTRKYFMWTLIATVATIVLPLIAAIFIVPWFLGSYLGSISNLGI